MSKARIWCAIASLGALPWSGPALAQDALAGKRLYLDVGRTRNAGVSCVDCHGGLPGGAFGIGRAANDPAAVERAVSAIPQMAPLRGRLAGGDFADLAAYIGQPNVSSPLLVSVTTGPGASGPERVRFGVVRAGEQSTTSRWQIANRGAVTLQLTTAPKLRGDGAADFRIIATDCAAGQPLAMDAVCSVDLVFRPSLGTGVRRAAVALGHDWVGGEIALALEGEVEAAPVTTPQAPAAGPGGGGAMTGLSMGVLAAAVCALRQRRRHLSSCPRRA